MIFRAKDIINWLKRSAFHLITLLHWQCRRSSRNHSSISLCMAWVEQNPSKNPGGGKDLTDWFRESFSNKATYYLSDCHWRKICYFLSPCRQGVCELGLEINPINQSQHSWSWLFTRSSSRSSNLDKDVQGRILYYKSGTGGGINHNDTSLLEFRSSVRLIESPDKGLLD